MKNELIICFVCFLIVGIILISGCTQFQNETNVNNTTSPEPNLSSSSEEGPPSPESFPSEEGPPILP